MHSMMKLHYSRHHDWMDIHREHAAIVEAIKKGDKKAAIENLQENIR